MYIVFLTIGIILVLVTFIQKILFITKSNNLD